MNNLASLSLIALPDIPLIQPGDDLVGIILSGLDKAGLVLQAGDVLVITSKIVSKAEGRMVDLRAVQPGEATQQLAAEIGKDPRIVELVLQESVAVSRTAPGVLITRHRLGFTCANAGIDQSNIGGDDQFALLLPVDPDQSAARIRDGLCEATGVGVGIVISDSHGRPFRMGNIGVGIGVAGVPALLDLRGHDDLFGRTLRVSTQGYADLIASASQLVSGEGSEGLPVVLIRGLRFSVQQGRASDLNRSSENDLYR